MRGDGDRLVVEFLNLADECDLESRDRDDDAAPRPQTFELADLDALSP